MGLSLEVKSFQNNFPCLIFCVTTIIVPAGVKCQLPPSAKLLQLTWSNEVENVYSG